MFALKKSKRKTNKKAPQSQGKKILYVFLLILGANCIVLFFLIYFIVKLYMVSASSSTQSEIPITSLPQMSDNSEILVSARSYTVYDPAVRTVIFSKNPKLRISPASSIKILTALVALDAYPLQQYLTVNTTASPDESKMGLYWGEEVNVENLLYGLLLASGNDAAKTLAGNFLGGSDMFVKAMNEKAKIIGLSESQFYDPSGYLDQNYSTASDLARLGAHAMQNEIIRRIVGTRNYVAHDKYGMAMHPLVNLNELLINPNVTGIKTGFTNEAGGVLITNYVHEGRNLIIVVMKSEDRFYDTRTIIDAIQKRVTYSDIGAAL